MCPHAQVPYNSNLSGRKIRCLLAHDHVLLRQGLRRLLEDEPDIEVVAEAQEAAEALVLVFELRPEAVIMDARLFGCAPAQAEQVILRTHPNCKVVLLTGSGRAPDGLESATTFAVRETSADQLAEMVRAVAGRGDAAEWTAGKDILRKGGALTQREMEILKLLVGGKTVRSVAGMLGLSVKTVDAHKFNLMRKLGVHNKAELVMSAIQKGVVKLPASY